MCRLFAITALIELFLCLYRIIGGVVLTFAASQAGVKFGLQVGIDMAYPIQLVDSPSHPIKVKKTDTKAVVELRASNQGNPLDRGALFACVFALDNLVLSRFVCCVCLFVCLS